MVEFTADPSHPRYASLLSRHKLEKAAEQGLLAESALIAHGRGEAYDYLLGEHTSDNAREATENALAHLKAAKRPVISINGNTTALAGYELLRVAEFLNCPLEVNIFYRTEQRIDALLSHLESIKSKHNIDVEIFGREPNSRITGLKGPRAKCCHEGIFVSDVILVPLEDGDRCEALVSMGKTVIVVDLNPLSRSSKKASITIVDEITRVAKNMVNMIENHKDIEINIGFDNLKNLQKSVNIIASNYSEI